MERRGDQIPYPATTLGFPEPAQVELHDRALAESYAQFCEALSWLTEAGPLAWPGGPVPRDYLRWRPEEGEPAVWDTARLGIPLAVLQSSPAFVERTLQLCPGPSLAQTDVAALLRWWAAFRDGPDFAALTRGRRPPRLLQGFHIECRELDDDFESGLERSRIELLAMNRWWAVAVGYLDPRLGPESLFPALLGFVPRRDPVRGLARILATGDRWFYRTCPTVHGGSPCATELLSLCLNHTEARAHLEPARREGLFLLDLTEPELADLRATYSSLHEPDLFDDLYEILDATGLRTLDEVFLRHGRPDGPYFFPYLLESLGVEEEAPEDEDEGEEADDDF